MAFKLTAFWRVFLSVVCVAGALAFVGLPVVWIVNDPQWTTLQCVLLAVGAGVMAFTFRELPKFSRYQIEIHPGFIRYQGAFSATELRFEDIEGYRVIPTQYVETLLIAPKTKAQKKIQLALTYQRKAEFLQWLAANLTDLDRRDRKAALEEILADNNLGSTEAERRDKLANARKWARTLTFVSFIALAWGIFRPHPYQYVLGLLLALPLIALLMIVLSRGLIRYDENRGTAYPTIAAALTMPPIALLLRALLDWSLLDWHDIIGPFSILGVSLSTALWIAVADMRKKIGLFLGGACFCFIYAYGAIIHLNCFYDRSEPFVYDTMIRDQRISKGKQTSYYLTLAPFVDDIPKREVQVPAEIYHAHPIGAPAKIILREGRIGAAWFLVR